VWSLSPEVNPVTTNSPSISDAGRKAANIAARARESVSELEMNKRG
jgi:hypothetical protein